MPSKTLRQAPNPSGLCECGCGQRTPIAKKTRGCLGHVKGEPIRYCQSHFKRQTRWDRFVETEDSNCWIWQGSQNGDGYGLIRTEGQSLLTHRAYYELLVGRIPEGLVIDHLCRNAICCNPGHLEPVTQRENVMRGNCPSAIHAAKTHCVHGHEFTLENTYIYADGSRRCRTCDREAHRRKRGAS